MFDTMIHIYSDDSGKEIFSYKFVKEDRIEIQKWFDPSGDIVIPKSVQDNIYIRGIGHNAFELTENTASICIPPTIYKIAPDSFVYTGDRFYSPYIKIDEPVGRPTQLRKYLIEFGWEKVYESWGRLKFIRPGLVQRYSNPSSGVDFIYRMINSHEVEIVRWNSPSDYIHIPQEVHSMKVSVLGEQSFADISEAQEIFVPDSVKRIEGEAFYYENEAEYIYGDLYDLGWNFSDKPQGTCRLRLPGAVKISNVNALYRKTWYRDRRRGDQYENDLIISLPVNAEALSFLTDNHWRIARTDDDLAYLIYEDFETRTFAKV